MQPLGALADTADLDRRLADWIAAATGRTGVRPGRLLVGGNANVTRLVETAQGPLVLRHPPADAVSDKAAAGIAREYAALEALAGAARVPEAVAWCDDPAVIGQPFSLTGFVEGVAVTDRLPESWPAGCAGVDAIGRDLVRALGEVHRVDPAGRVPDRFGAPEGFISRQIDRWCEVRARHTVRELPQLASQADWLRMHAPPLLAARLIHCDFHLDNCLARLDRPQVAAIIDWEMATLGDPRIDLGLVLFFWQRDPAAAPGFSQIQAISNRADAVGRDRLAGEWSKASGLPADDLDYFRAFAAWRLAAIVEGAYVLYREGKVDTAYARGLEHDVPALLAEVDAIIEGRGA